ncbi:MAG: 4-hydroxy-tetrahydrodipicolinate synthase [Candidatus Dormibacteraceae bacterium]
MGREIGRLLTAMVTPFHDDGSLNLGAAQALAGRLLQDGSDGVVLAGTTGEAPTLDDDEKIELIRAVREAIPDGSVVAGTGSNDTRHSIALSERAMAAGADALLAVVPYYNRPPQEGIFRHFQALAEVGPTIMYNIQSRTGVNMTAQTTLRAAELPGVIGVKEASGDLTQIGLICASRPPGFQVWSGDDALTLPLLGVGGDGVICVVSHLAGTAMRGMIEAHANGEQARATAIHLRLLPLMRALMTASTSPIPVKSVLARLGFETGPFRLPLVPMPSQDLVALMGVVEDSGELISVGVALG